MEISPKDLSQMLRIMEGLHCSAEEAREIIKADKAIDKGANPFPLTAEQEKASKDARQADRKPTIYKLDNTNGKRSKKTDNDKRFLIDALVWCLTTDDEQAGDNVQAENVEIINPEREIVFQYHGKKYKIVLSAPRS